MRAFGHRDDDPERVVLGRNQRERKRNQRNEIGPLYAEPDDFRFTDPGLKVALREHIRTNVLLQVVLQLSQVQNVLALKAGHHTRFFDQRQAPRATRCP